MSFWFEHSYKDEAIPKKEREKASEAGWLFFSLSISVTVSELAGQLSSKSTFFSGRGIMGSLISSTSKKMSNQEMEVAVDKANSLSTSAPVVVFSKTYCGYCKRVKQLLTQLGASFKTIELDVESDGQEIQQALAKWTGQRTVPNMFIGGKHVGGCDDVVDKHQKGELLPLLKDSGAIANNSAQL